MNGITLGPNDRFDDGTVLVANKEPGLLSVPGRGPDKQDCLIARLQKEYPAALVVHRLDQATSGLMVFALTKDAQRALSRQFELREVKKEYEALLTVMPAGGWKGRIERMQRLDVEARPLQIIDPLQGKKGVTVWKILEAGETVRVRFYPETGRTHQLRLHARELGAPIMGDSLYGNGSEGERMMLHAARLAFRHPVTGEEFVFHSPVPF